ncbi:hypothetical protein WJX84_005501 [Apatococcus fuscideae]|uniref:Uncharacterized protein n=1 Tax=Apatococcus fuscideae TaxID=2026836 RepID=A0AAW1TD41_9CHLO
MTSLTTVATRFDREYTLIQAQTETPGTHQDTCSSATSRMSHTGCPVLDGDSNGSSIKQATTPRNAADAIRTSGGIPSNTADIRSNKQDASHASQFGDHKSEARIQSNQQMTESILDASSAAHGGEENDMSDYKGAMHGSGPHASYK